MLLGTIWRDAMLLRRERIIYFAFRDSCYRNVTIVVRTPAGERQL